MSFKAHHSWNLSPARARAIQTKLAKKVVVRDRLGTIRTVAGADCAFVKGGVATTTPPHPPPGPLGLAIAGVILFRWPDLVEIERAWAAVPLRFPYVPGLLTFREGPALMAAFKKLKTLPDLIFIDGQGIAHPRGIGIASHIGLLIDRPTIGCAKSLLVGDFREPGLKKGDWLPLTLRGKPVGSVLRTRDNVRPIFVSPGHRVSVATARRIVIGCLEGFRIPKPTRLADLWVAELKRSSFGG